MKTVVKLLCLVVVFLSLFTLSSTAQTEVARDMKKEEALWQQLSKISPDSVETFKAATAARDKGDFQEAIKLYREVLKKAPDFDPALRRLGIALAATGQKDEALALADKAIKINRSFENLGTKVAIMIEPENGNQDNVDWERAFIIAREANEKNTEGDAYGLLLLAETAMRAEKEIPLRDTAKTLVEKHPEVMEGHYYYAVISAYDSNWPTAESEIKKAESLGLPHETAQSFLDETGAGWKGPMWRFIYIGIYALALWPVGILLLFIVGKILSSRTLRWIETSDPNDMSGKGHTGLRKFYKYVINIAGVYYYISQPVIIFLVMASAAGLIYLFFWLGRIPIKLVLILAIGAVATVFYMIRALLTRTKTEDPGRALAEDEAPGLWALTKDVAGVVGTRPVDEIRITPGTDLAVYERGSMRERMQDKAHRILILGTGTLNGFRQNAFRAVLAHEYGHFSHRDTAGGDVALRVNADMIRFAISIMQSGHATYWNIAFQFLRLYHFIFRRITHGATRLQEILADRVAVYQYGQDAFREGLTHVIKRDVEFNHVASKELNEAVRTKRAVQNLYELPPEQDEKVNKTLEEAYNEIISRETTEDDTHPSPNDRFLYASRIKAKEQPPADGEMVWELFANKEALTKEMSEYVEKRAKTVYY